VNPKPDGHIASAESRFPKRRQAVGVRHAHHSTAGLQFQTLEVVEVEIRMPYQDKLSFAPGAYQAGATGTIMEAAASDVVLHC
jgi:hypothetical protein